mmetsp:Transcript_14375/g.41486  ORF Transcript_14375/g.41486 Transcript_14375/m.41486 type:complete len:207 (+) Transcript_14375:594-1214(+)
MGNGVGTGHTCHRGRTEKAEVEGPLPRLDRSHRSRTRWYKAPACGEGGVIGLGRTADGRPGPAGNGGEMARSHCREVTNSSHQCSNSLGTTNSKLSPSERGVLEDAPLQVSKRTGLFRADSTQHMLHMELEASYLIIASAHLGYGPTPRLSQASRLKWPLLRKRTSKASPTHCFDSACIITKTSSLDLKVTPSKWDLCRNRAGPLV